MTNPTELYQMLLNKQCDPSDLPLAELYELGDQMAIVGGNFSAKKIIYDWIERHLQATDDDRFRVSVFRFDLLRRQGKTDEAYCNLLVMAMEQRSVSAQLEYLQAIGQCLLVLKRFDEAVDAQRQLIELMDQNVLVRRRLYYLETMLALKQHASQYDDELDGCLDLSLNLLNEATELSEPERNRALGGLRFVQGQQHIAHGAWRQAAGCFAQEFEFGPADREKVVGSLMYLYSRLREITDDPDAALHVAFLRGHLNSLQPTDIQILQKEYDVVVKAFGITPPKAEQ